MFEEPDIHFIDFSAGGDESRAARERQAAEGRRRYLGRVEGVLVGLGLEPERAAA